MSEEEKDNKEPDFHLEQGLPVFNTRLSEVERKQDRSDAQEQGYKDRQLAINTTMARATVVLMVATVIIGIINGYQACVAKLNADTAKQAANTAAHALKDSEDSFAKTLCQMRAQTSAQQDAVEVARNDQRSWVGPVEVILPDVRGKSNDHFGVSIANSGKTPAMKIMTKISTQYLKTNVAFTPVYKPVQSSTGVSVLQPSMRLRIMSLAYPGILTDQEMRGLITGESTLYMYGMITYDDIFNRPHWAKFCMYLDRDLRSFAACKTYNEAN